MTPKKIVITGGPGSGKTSIINELLKRKYHCFPEISREVTLEAQETGIKQPFLDNPISFSEKLLHGRVLQHKAASAVKSTLVFFDRGIHDVIAYMDFIDNECPELFHNACTQYRYDLVFILPPWEEIYTSDSERYEDFNEASRIYESLKNTYIKYNYNLVEVPFGEIPERTNFILNLLTR